MISSRLGRGLSLLKPSQPKRLLTTTPTLHEKPLPPRIKIDENSITESFLKGSGPGGQKINKTSSAVQLKHLPTGIVVKCQDTRSRDQNRRTARRLLAERLEEREKGSESRTAIKADKARAKKASKEKKTRRKYRKLAEEREDGGKGDVEAGAEEMGDEEGGSGVNAEETGSEEGDGRASNGA